jgi:hypothetical protein
VVRSGTWRAPLHNPEATEINPANFVKAWKTVLVIPARSTAVPYAGLQPSLQRRASKPLRVLPDENHWILKPANSLSGTRSHRLARHYLK